MCLFVVAVGRVRKVAPGDGGASVPARKGSSRGEAANVHDEPNYYNTSSVGLARGIWDFAQIFRKPTQKGGRGRQAHASESGVQGQKKAQNWNLKKYISVGF